MRLTPILLTTVMLTGCATVSQPEIELKSKVSQSKDQACVAKEVARYAALVEIAKTGDETAKVAAIMSMQHPSSCQ